VVGVVSDPPGFARRLACLMYEGVLLFGVVMVAGFLYSGLTQQRHALVGMHGLQAFLFVVLGIYFTWFWAGGRQTVAMKTWRLRLVTRDGRPLSQSRALARYIASWLWFVPALVALGLGGWRSGAATAAALTGSIVAYALLARLTPSRQYLHDLICGTRLQAWPAAAPAGQNRAP
jgi:uncharacterized RDD family membrane protein YckC